MAGRPKRVFTEEQEAEIMDTALHGCQNNTIATLLSIPVNTLTRHFGKLLTEKRAERKYNLRVKQDKLAVSNPAVAIFLGKNELGQKDSKDLNIGGSVSIVLEKE